MTSSRLEHPTNTTGAHRARRRAPRSGPRAVVPRPPARYEPYLDGLFTYCLSVLCDHDAATAVLGEVLAVAERHHGRTPAEPSLRRAWLYALARWACLRELARRRRARHSGAPSRRPAHTDGSRAAKPAPRAPHSAPHPAHPPHTRPTAPHAPHAPRPAAPHAGPAPHAAQEPAAPDAPGPAPARQTADEEAGRRRAELALLAWPEAAGTTPEQREALELAVRHQMGAPEVAAVLGMTPQAARELLSAAACEVERTRAALAVVETGTCPAVARLTGDHRVLLSAALRRELVRHVDDCPRCRRTAERAEAAGPWPGSTVTPATLPLVPAPRPAAYAAMLHAPRARSAGPRFGRDGFPLDPKDHAARRDRMRARAVTTTVVATVVAAPVLALWAAYRGDTAVGDGRGDTAFSATDEAGGRSSGSHYANAGSAHADPRTRTPRQAPDVSVEVLSSGSAHAPALSGRTGPGRVTVAARPYGDATMLTLTATGGSPVGWSLWTDAPWLYASRTSGTLEPGTSVTVYVSVDRAREPRGPWSARIHVSPSGAVVSLTGYGSGERPAPARPKPSGRPSAPPSAPHETPPDPAPTPPASSEPPPATEPPPSSQPPAPTDTPPPATDPPGSEPPASDPQPQ
ncbi:BACON domain-containing protein [Streptomyces sp. enrichment culture]|uniref:BACON domain-containing protein n=1 Tax=Streptomyces sp. enrichment culture TaxID=1795815 RepID=UPI003F558F2D